MMNNTTSNNRGNFKSIFEEHYSALCNYAYKILGHNAEAEDIVQTVFIQLWEKDRLKDVKHIESYLLRSVKFKCIDALRARVGTVEFDTTKHASSEAQSDISNDGMDIDAMLHYFAAKLPPKTREVFLLSRTDGLTYKEIAARCDISVKTVENQMGRALKHLRVILAAENLLILTLLLCN